MTDYKAKRKAGFVKERKYFVLLTLVLFSTLSFATQEPNGVQRLSAEQTKIVQQQENDKTKTQAELTITSDDFALAKGLKTIWSMCGCDGTVLETTTEVCDEIQLGDITIYKFARIVDGKSEPSGYAKKSKEALEFYPLTGGQMPGGIIRFPLVKGKAYEYQNIRGKVKMRVEGQEEVNVPAGKFMCLVIVQETAKDGNTVTGKSWIAPGFGIVRSIWPCAPQAKEKEMVSVLKTIQMGELRISNFDFDPLVSVAFPNSRWRADKGDKDAFSVCDIDTTTGAAGTPFSLKWSYKTRATDANTDMNTWVNVGLLLSGSWSESVDLSRYNSISFYIKAAAKKHCTFKMQTGPWKEKRLSGVCIPLELTPEWQKVVIDLKTRPEFKDVDLTKTYTIELVDGSKEEISSVVWIDEIMLHKTNDKIKSETIDKEL